MCLVKELKNKAHVHLNLLNLFKKLEKPNIKNIWKENGNHRLHIHVRGTFNAKFTSHFYITQGESHMEVLI